MEYFKTGQLINRIFTVEVVKQVPSVNGYDVVIRGTMNNEPFWHTFSGSGQPGREILEYREHLPIDVKLVKIGRRLSIQTP